LPFLEYRDFIVKKRHRGWEEKFSKFDNLFIYFCITPTFYHINFTYISKIHIKDTRQQISEQNFDVQNYKQGTKPFVVIIEYYIKTFVFKGTKLGQVCDA
jgi:hypothetical protein